MTASCTNLLDIYWEPRRSVIGVAGAHGSLVAVGTQLNCPYLSCPFFQKGTAWLIRCHEVHLRDRYF